MSELKVGVIGAGVMGSNHIRTIRRLPETRLDKVFDPFPSSQSKSELDGVLTEDLSTFLDSHLDYVVIASPTSTHKEVASQVAKAGIPTIIEKPLAATSADARIIFAEYATRGIKAAVGFVERFNPAVIKAQELLRQGAIGETLQISLRREGPLPARIQDVGVAVDLASHDVDLAMWLLDSELEVLNGFRRRVVSPVHEDLWLAHGKAKNGTFVNITVNRLSPLKSRLTRILGSSGMLEIDTMNLHVTQTSGDSLHVSWDAASQFNGARTFESVNHKLDLIEPIYAEHKAFQEFLREDKIGSLSTLENGVKVLEWIEGIS